MTTSLKRSALKSSIAFAAIFAFALQGSGAAFAAGTAPGTTISNQASATYTDGNGTAYTTTSNTVTTVVQNSPSLTVTPGPAQTVASGATVTDPVTLTNTGNATGTFAVTGDTSGSGTLLGYSIPGSTACPPNPPVGTPYCTLAQVNTALAALPAAVNGTQVVNVVYTAPTVTTGTTTTTAQTLSATITQAATTAAGAVAATPAATSPAVTDTPETDTINPQARLDLQKTVNTPATATAPLVFTINGNNGGAFNATDLTSAEAILNATNAGTVTKPGILVTDKIPTFTPTGGTATQLLLTAASTGTLAAPLAGQTAQIFYTTSATGTTGWTATYTAGTAYTYVGLYISGSTAAQAAPNQGTGTYELASKPGGSTGAGNVTTPEFTLTLNVAQPVGLGASNANAISNIANGVIGGNPNTNGSVPVVGPGIPTGVEDGTTTAANDLPGEIANTTPSSGTTPPGGSSNAVTAGALATDSVSNGPANNAGATGLYPNAPAAAGAASTQNDFTAVGTTCTTTPTVNTSAATPPVLTPSACTGSAAVTIPATFTNTGNASDTYTISAVAPPGYSAQIFAVTGNCTTGGATSNTALAGVTCTQGAAISTVATSGNSATTTAALTVGQGASQSYEVVYTPTGSNPAFTPIDSAVSVAGSGGTIGTPSADDNVTHNDIIPGGPIELTKTAATECPPATTFSAAAAGSATAVPGCIIQYTVTYTNTVTAASVSAASLGTGAPTPEPAFAYSSLQVPTANNLVITEDGGTTAVAASATPANNWYTYSNGLNAAPTNTAGAAPTYAYFTQANATQAAAAGAAKFTATVGGGIAAGTTGNVIFMVTVK